jgi:hypothetical protein
MEHDDRHGSTTPPHNWWESLAVVRVNQTGCRTELVGRISHLEEWKKLQNGELQNIRKRITITLVSVILLLIGIVANLILDRATPPPDIALAVRTEMAEQLGPIIESVVEQILERQINPP